uniref:Uncharacterized protein n=1 Tax=Rhizophora mucronata TaxID=61149 RepID=A0A2P2PTG3_RHIMU
MAFRSLAPSKIEMITSTGKGAGKNSSRTKSTSTSRRCSRPTCLLALLLLAIHKSWLCWTARASLFSLT